MSGLFLILLLEADCHDLVQITIACLYCLLASGVVFGYAAFKQVLIHEGTYRDLCPHDEPLEQDETCYEQEVRYVWAFRNVLPSSPNL